jgi:glycosyltransferase involved in cell wall biosynthesis
VNGSAPAIQDIHLHVGTETLTSLAKQRMRILYSHRVQSHDGQSVHIEELVTALQQAGHEVLVVGPRFYEKARFGGESSLVAMVRRILPSALAEVAEILYNLPAYSRLRRAYRSITPDFIYERYNLYYLAGMLLRRRYGVPLCLEVNSPLAEERARFGSLRLRRLARALERLVWRSADRIFVVTGVLKEIVASAGVSRERIIVIPNGVDQDSYPADPYQTRPGTPLTIGFVGFVRSWHGLDSVIAGLASERDNPLMRLIIVGDGPARLDLERQAETLDIRKIVEFTGVQNRQEIPEVIRTFDIALQPRAVSYASPLKLFEYMASGRAIVAPDQPNIREILTHEETAILFDPDDPPALWRAISRLVWDPQLRERLGRAARRALEARDYSWQANAARVTAAVAAVLPPSDAAVDVGPPADRSLSREAR